MEERQSTASQSPSYFRRLSDTLLSTLRNRLELLALELQEERQWMVVTLIWTAVALFFGFAAAVVVTFTIVFLCPEAARPWGMTGFSLIYVTLATVAVWVLRKKVKEKPPPLSDSLSELKKDLSLFHAEK